MREYLNDIDFLTQLDKLNLRTQYAKITLLTWDEQPIREIQGQITGGSLSVNGSSAVRRTINLTMLANEFNSNLENIDNEISINKKIRIEIGYENLFVKVKYLDDPIIWFPCGLFILSTASISRSTSGWNISISGKDKMCLLDGTAGGVLPASITFHESYIYHNNGDIEIIYPTIFKIIYEAVNHWGGEAMENIIISDLEETCRLLIKYVGDEPVYFSDNYGSLYNLPSPDFPHMVSYGQDAGYRETDFTYPGELILAPGETVVSLLDKIVNVLGNFEYFYDVNGKFIFQEIKNYLNTGSPLLELNENDYVKSYNNAKFLYSLTDLDTTTAITRSPKYDNIKNDFYVWGKRTTNSGIEVDIRYHLAIDARPPILLANKYMWEIRDSETKLLLRYEFSDLESNRPTIANNEVAELISLPSTEYREELYRRALNAQVTNSVYDNYYDSELIAEWRNLYDPMREAWQGTGFWNPAVFNDPGSLNFWLEIIDTGSEIGRYSINRIGRRTKVINDTNIKTVYNMEVPDIIFLDEFDADKILSYRSIGQKIFVLNDEYKDLFVTSSTGTSCFDKIREMLYQNLNYNTTISLTCLPKYYIEPNNIIYIEDKESGISGNYLITQFTLPLAYNGTMSITATEVLTRV